MKPIRLSLLRILLATTVVLAMAGCASPRAQFEAAEAAVEAHRTVLRSAQPVDYRSPAANRGYVQQKMSSYSMDETAPVLEFAGQRAFFVRFMLPAFREPYHIEVITESLGVVRSMRLMLMKKFTPALVLLDENFQVIEELYPEYSFDNYRYMTIAGMLANISICDPRAVYLVIRGVPELHGRTETVLSRTDPIHMPGVVYIASGTDRSERVHWPFGNFWLGVPDLPVGDNLAFRSENPVKPCSVPDRPLRQFLDEIGQRR